MNIILQNISDNAQRSCIIKMILKKNNVFVNLTKTNGNTIIKFTSGLIQKKKNKKQLHNLIKWIFEKLAYFIQINFNNVKIIIKGNIKIKPSYFKEIKRKKLKIINYQHIIPIIHNGCKPLKKRRI